jgi:MFS family permease
MIGPIAVLYALDLGANILQINLITAIRSTMGILLLVPFGILSDRLGRKPMILFSRAVITLGTLIRAFATDPNHLLIAAFVGGFAGGMIDITIVLSMIADIAEPKEQHEGVSTLLLFNGVGMLLGPIVCSMLLTLPQMTLRSIYHIGVVAQICTLLYMMIGIKETTPKTASGARIVYRNAIRDLARRKDFQGLLLAIFLYAFSDSVRRNRLVLHLSQLVQPAHPLFFGNNPNQTPNQSSVPHRSNSLRNSELGMHLCPRLSLNSSSSVLLRHG